MSVSLTPEQLQDIISSAVSSAVREARKPADPTPKELAEEARKLAERKSMAELEEWKRQNRLAQQATCNHLRKNGSTPAVYVQNGNLMICQWCQAVIRPGEPTEQQIKDGTMGIWDTDLFNRLLALSLEGKD